MTQLAKRTMIISITTPWYRIKGGIISRGLKFLLKSLNWEGVVDRWVVNV